MCVSLFYSKLKLFNLNTCASFPSESQYEENISEALFSCAVKHLLEFLKHIYKIIHGKFSGVLEDRNT